MNWKLTADEDFELTNALMDNPHRCQVYMGMPSTARRLWAFKFLKIEDGESRLVEELPSRRARASTSTQEEDDY